MSLPDDSGSVGLGGDMISTVNLKRESDSIFVHEDEQLVEDYAYSKPRDAFAVS